MIRGQRNVCVAVRRPDGTVAVRRQPLSPLFTGPARRVPLVRGIVALAEMLTLGMKALNFSANVGMEAEGEEMSGAAMALMMAVSLLFAVGVFFLAPLFASHWLEGLLGSSLAANIAEGVIRLVLFLAYILLIGRMNDIRRVFMYHGAEHMTVHAQERGDPLEVAAVRKYPTAHPRCGTAFLLVVMVVSVIAFVFVGTRAAVVAGQLARGADTGDSRGELRADSPKRKVRRQPACGADHGAQSRATAAHHARAHRRPDRDRHRGDAPGSGRRRFVARRRAGLGAVRGPPRFPRCVSRSPTSGVGAAPPKRPRGERPRRPAARARGTAGRRFRPPSPRGRP